MARRGISDVSLPPCSCDDEKQDLTFSALNSIVGYRRHSKTDWCAFWGNATAPEKEADKVFSGIVVERERALGRKWADAERE